MKKIVSLYLIFCFIFLPCPAFSNGTKKEASVKDGLGTNSTVVNNDEEADLLSAKDNLSLEGKNVLSPGLNLRKLPRKDGEDTPALKPLPPAQVSSEEPEPKPIEPANFDPWKSLSGLKELFNQDAFTGAAAFRIPIWIPGVPNKNVLIPEVQLNYNSYSKDRLSPFGFGWDLNLNSISRLSRHGSNEIYNRDEFSYRLAGKSAELVLTSQSQNLYMAKFGNDLTQYYFENNSWRAIDTQGTTYYFGPTSTSRQENPEDSTEVFQWMLDRIVDIHGNEITYSYSHDHNQIYLSAINYMFIGENLPLYQIQFNYINKSTSAVSYQTQFPVETFKLLDNIEIKFYDTSLFKFVTKRAYRLVYDSLETATPHLVEVSQEAAGSTLPSLQFSYYSTSAALHLLQEVNNSQGGKMTFSYKPSTAYRKGVNQANSIPFVAQTLERVKLEDTTTQRISETSFTYFGGHYFVDYADVFGREFAGFHEVTSYEQNRIVTTYFHQSQLSGNDEASGEYDDHISKKGRPYQEIIYDTKGLTEIKNTKWEKIDLGEGRFYVLPKQITVSHFGTVTHEDEALEYQYDAYANIIEEKNLGKVVVASTVTGEVTSDIPGDLRKTVFTYALNTNANLVTSPSSKTLYDEAGTQITKEEYYYDGSSALGSITKGDLTKKRDWNSENANYIETKWSYDFWGNVISSKDPNGNLTTFVYDGVYYPFVVSVTQEGNSNDRDLTTTYSYDFGLGVLSTQIHPNGYQEKFVYDGFGRLVSKYVSENSNVNNFVLLESDTYNDFVQPFFIDHRIYPNQDNPAFSMDSRTYFDGFGRSIEQRKEDENGVDTFVVVDRYYDDRGNVIYETLPYFDSGLSFNVEEWKNLTLPGITTSFDPEDRPLTVLTRVGRTDYIYEGFKTIIFDPNGIQKDLYFDSYENLIQVTEYNQGQTYNTYYSYNPLNLLTQIKDAQGNIRALTYSSLGRRLSLQDIYNPNNPPSSIPVWIYAYDKNGNLLTQTNPDSQKIEYSYDEFNRVTQEKHNGVEKYGFSYSTSGFSRGQLVGVNASDIATSFNYDSHGNIIHESKTMDGKTFGTEFNFDLANQARNIIYPDATKIEYTYNDIGLVETLNKIDAQGNTAIVTGMSYSPLGQIAGIEYGNGVSLTNTYDWNELYRLRRKKALKGATTLQDLYFGYDRLGNILKIEESADTPARRDVYYTCDDLSRLKTVSASYTDSKFNYSQSYEYDAIGNITYKSDIGNYSYAGGNLANPHGATTIGTSSLTYDKNGNLIADSSRALSYDPRYLISQVVFNNLTTNYLYDHTGNRVLKKSISSEVWYPNKYFEVRKDEGIEKTYSYFYAGDLRLATFENASTLYYNLHDHLGGSALVTDTGGQVVEVTDYLPFGTANVNEKYGSYATSYTFTGKEEDPESDLFYFGARHYNDHFGKFTSIDPAVLAIGTADFREAALQELPSYLADPQNLNSYSYAHNNPISNKDVNGKIAILVPIVVGAAAGVVLELSFQLAESAIAGENRMNLNKLVTSAVKGALVAGVGVVAVASLGTVSVVAGGLHLALTAEKALEIATRYTDLIVNTLARETNWGTEKKQNDSPSINFCPAPKNNNTNKLGETITNQSANPDAEIRDPGRSSPKVKRTPENQPKKVKREK